MSVVIGVFVDKNIKVGARFEQLARCLYLGHTQRLYFAANPRLSTRQINAWAEESTNGKIREIVTPEQLQNTLMILANTIYFKDKWKNAFFESNTRPRPFYVNGRNRPPVNASAMATSGCFPYIDVKDWDAKIVGLPYQQGLSTMYLVVPNNSDRQKLSFLLSNTIDIGQLNNMIDRMEVKTGAVVMPKMQLKNNLGLKQVLSSFGISTLFDPYRSNLSVITNTAFDQDGDVNKSCHLNRRPEEQQNQPPRNVFQQSNVVIVSVAESRDCFFIRNCVYENNLCKCLLDPESTQDQEICPQTPFYASKTCDNKVISSDVWTVCHSEQYRKTRTTNIKVCLSSACTFFSGACYCCTGPKRNIRSIRQDTQQQPSQNSSSLRPLLLPTNPDQNHAPDQESLNNQSIFQQVLPHSALQVPPTYNNNQSNTSDAVVSCFEEQECLSLQGCRIIRKCFQRRLKRQGNRRLFVGDSVHKVLLDIEEGGTDGGAVKGYIRDHIPPSFVLRLDGPFLIYLRHDITKLPLFYGPVYDPRD